MKKSISVFVISYLALAMFMAAETSITRNTKLRIKHYNSGLMYQINNSDQVFFLSHDRENVFSIKPKEEIQIIIENQNPFYFKYSWEEIEKTETESYKAIQTALESLGSFIPLLDQTIAAKEDSEMRVKAMTFSAEGIINNALNEYEINESFLNNFMSYLKDLYNKNPEKPPKIYTKGESSIVEKRKKYLDWTLVDLKNKIEGSFEKIIRANKAVIALIEENKIKFQDYRNHYFFDYFFPYVISQKSLIDDVLNRLIIFQNNYKLINKDLVLSNIGYESNLKRKCILKIVELGETEKSTMNYTFVFEPKESPISLSIGIGGVYSFVEKIDYLAKENGEKFQIVEKDNGGNYSGLGVAVMFNLTLSKSKYWPIRPLLQLGFNPQKNSLAFFFGAGVEASNFFSFGAGYTQQQIPVLKNGLKLGQLIDSTDDLKTKNSFKGGFYIHITLSKSLK